MSISLVNLQYLFDNVISFRLFYHTCREVVKMIADRIKSLREKSNRTQSELAHIFHVSTDYLLGVNTTSTISVAGLTDQDIEIVNSLILHLKDIRN